MLILILRKSRFSPRSLTTPLKKCFNSNTPANTSTFSRLICLIQNSQIPKGTGGFYLHSAVTKVPNMGNHSNQPPKGLRSGNLPWDASLLNPPGSHLHLYHLHYQCSLGIEPGFLVFWTIQSPRYCLTAKLHRCSSHTVLLRLLGKGWSQQAAKSRKRETCSQTTKFAIKNFLFKKQAATHRPDVAQF